MRPVDHKSRMIALDPMESLIVSAPAGSGKTFLLTRRILNLLMHVDKPSQVVAITFTKKAACEMKHRLIQCLEEQSEDIAIKVMERSIALKWDILNNPDQLSIMTIDSFCSQLVSLTEQGITLPVSQSASTLYRDTIYTYYCNTQWTVAQRRLVAAFSGQYDQLEQLLIQLLATRDQWIDALKNNDLKACCQTALNHIITEHINSLHKKLEPLNNDIRKLFESHRHIAHVLDEECIYPEPSSQQEYLLHIADLFLTKSATPRKTLTKKQGIYPKTKITCYPDIEEIQKNFKLTHQSIIEQFESMDIISELDETRSLPISQTEDEQLFLEDLSSVLSDLLSNLKATFNQKLLSDFTDIALQAIQALQVDKRLQQFCHDEINHILIDEFQDTSLTQYQLLESLLKCWPEDQHRTLFAVGDPMQSIYRFRQADVRLFLKLQSSKIAHIDLKPISLACNFRSSSKLIMQINDLFTTVFPPQDIERFAAIKYRPATPTKPIEEHHGIYLYNEQSDEACAQAMRTVKLIQSLSTKHPNESIAILVQARSHLANIIPLLEQYDIPFNAVDIYPTVNLSSIQDLSALYAFLTDPHDALSKMIIMRSPLCGLSLDALATISHSPPKDFDSKLLHELDQTLYNKLISTITQARSNHMHPVHQVWFVWHQLSGEQIYPKDQLPAIHNWFEEVSTLFQENHALSRSSILSHFSKAYLSRSTPNAQVELLTAHKSKGLEYEHVIIPHMEKRKPSASTPLFFTEQASSPIIQPTFTKNDTNNHYFKNLNKKRDYYESLRLLYVASTRAKSTLHLIGYMQDKPNTGSWLEAIWSHALRQEDIRTEISETESTSINSHTNTKIYHTQIHQVISQITQPEIHNTKHADIGTHLHYLMQILTHPNRDQKWAYYLAQLHLSQIEKTELRGHGEKIISMLSSSQHLQWIMTSHLWHRNEFHVHLDDKLHIIDRSFKDGDATWIIDYKFPVQYKSNNDLTINYAEQLDGYKAALAQTMDNIRCALYLPLEDRLINMNQT